MQTKCHIWYSNLLNRIIEYLDSGSDRQYPDNTLAIRVTQRLIWQSWQNHRILKFIWHYIFSMLSVILSIQRISLSAVLYDWIESNQYYPYWFFTLRPLWWLLTGFDGTWIRWRPKLGMKLTSCLPNDLENGLLVSSV